MTQIPNPDGWMDVITILLAVAMMSVPSWFAIKAHKSSEAVRDQVQNGHKQPMRADLDRAIESIDILGKEVRGLRDEILSEEQRRRSHIDELRADVDRRFVHLEKRFTK